jgi:hypothetical protein
MATQPDQINGMPNMSATLDGWLSPVTLTVISQSVDGDGIIIPTEDDLTFSATVQPLSTKELKLKPESQRAFEWLQIHVQGKGRVLDDGDVIKFNAKDYRIMKLLGYDLNGFREYHAMEKYA